MDSRFRRLAALLSLALTLSGCLSFRVEKVTIGADTPPAAAELREGKATLADILSRCGAPLIVEDIGGKTLLVYEKKFYRGAQITLGLPLSDILATNLNLNTYGRLWRYDTVGMVLDRDMVLERVYFARGSTAPLWQSFWEDPRPGQTDPSP